MSRFGVGGRIDPIGAPFMEKASWILSPVSA